MPDPTAEQLARESGEAIANAIADNLESVILKMADAIAKVQAQQDATLADVMALEKRLGSLERVLASRTDHLA